MANIITCKHIVPLYCNVIDNKKDDNSKLAVVSYLCIDKFDTLFTIDKGIPVNSEDDILSFECLPYAESELDFVSRKIEHKWLGEYLPRYTSNLKFFTNENKSKVYTIGVKSGTKKKFKIEMSNEIFMSLLYFDTYPFADINDAVLESTTMVAGVKNFTKETELIIPDTITSEPILEIFEPVAVGFKEKIKAIFNKGKIETVEVGTVYNFSYGKRSISLFDYDPSVAIAISESVFNKHFGKGNQYKYTMKIDNVMVDDKEYTAMRGVNKNGSAIVVLLDKSKL